MALLDGCLYASPGLRNTIIRANMLPLFLPRQIYNDENESMPKIHSSMRSNLILYWTGVGLNRKQNVSLLSSLRLSLRDI